jgi:hypothetical protein
MKGRYQALLLVGADGHGKMLPALRPSPVDDGSSGLRGHPYEKAVGPQSSFLAGLKCSFRHGFFLITPVFSSIYVRRVPLEMKAAPGQTTI